MSSSQAQQTTPVAADGTAITRTIRCPHCRREFSTARRWQLACPACAYEWDEENHYKAGQDLKTDAPQYLVLGILWAVAIAMMTVVLGAAGYFVWWLIGQDAGAALSLGALLALATICMVVIHPRSRSSIWAPSKVFVAWLSDLVGWNYR
jgi:hypothetical protein